MAQESNWCSIVRPLSPLRLERSLLVIVPLLLPLIGDEAVQLRTKSDELGYYLAVYLVLKHARHFAVAAPVQHMLLRIRAGVEVRFQVWLDLAIEIWRFYLIRERVCVCE